MALFEWKPEYSVSVLRFDNEHKKLFALINELNDAMVEKRGRAVVAHVLKELSDYVRWHFAAEEDAMRRAGYADLERHIAQHRELTKEVERYCSEFETDASTSPVDLLFFLGKWLQKHILFTDQQYTSAMNKAGIH